MDNQGLHERKIFCKDFSGCEEYEDGKILAKSSACMGVHIAQRNYRFSRDELKELRLHGSVSFRGPMQL